MKKTDVQDEIMKFVMSLENNTGKQPISLDADLFQKGILDSMAFMELLHFLEKEYEILIEDDVIFSNVFNTLEDITEYICRQPSS